MTQKTWIDLLGIPQGDEIVHGNMISRKINHNTYQRLWNFDHPEHAQHTYDIWMDEYAELSFKDGERVMVKLAKVNKIFSFHYNGQDIYCLHRTGQRKGKEYKYTMVSSSKLPSSYVHMEDHLEEEDILSSLPAIFMGENND